MTEAPFHIIVRSRGVSTDFCLGILERVHHSVANSRGRIREDIRFTEPEKMVDATTSFTGAFTRPIPLKNFAEGSDELVVLVRYSKWQAASDKLEHELLATVDEILRWEQGNFLGNLRILFEGSAAPSVGIERLKSGQGWKLNTTTYNEWIKRGRISVESQKELFYGLAQVLGKPFGQTDCRFDNVDGYLQFHPGVNPRVYSDDGNIGFGDTRMHHKLYLQATDQETQSVVDALKSYVKQFQMTGRIEVRMGIDREHYEAWREAFEHREAAYEYLFRGYLTDSATDFLDGKLNSAPQGIVPYAQYWSKGKGGVSLSLDFADDSVRFWLSGSDKLSEEGMKEFLREIDLLQLTDESCVIFR